MWATGIGEWKSENSKTNWESTTYTNQNQTRNPLDEAVQIQTIFERSKPSTSSMPSDIAEKKEIERKAQLFAKILPGFSLFHLPNDLFREY